MFFGQTALSSPFISLSPTLSVLFSFLLCISFLFLYIFLLSLSNLLDNPAVDQSHRVEIFLFPDFLSPLYDNFGLPHTENRSDLINCTTTATFSQSSSYLQLEGSTIQQLHHRTITLQQPCPHLRAPIYSDLPMLRYQDQTGR